MKASVLGLSSALLALVISSCSAKGVVDDDAGVVDMGDSAPMTCATMCNGNCTDTKTDNANCGKCGNACPMGASCVQGSCQCMNQQTRCGNACVDLKTDNANCGKCGQACNGGDAGAPMGGGMWGCQAGTCSVICPMGKSACGNGCVDLQTDQDNCGMCGNGCQMTESCVSGMCCPTGQSACSGMCVDTKTDPNNCGMCGNKCPMNMPSCGGGKCQVLFTFSGVKTNFSDSLLAGWQLCYSDKYGNSGTSLMGTILSKCSGNNLLLACRQVNSNTITVAAHAPRADVIFDTGTSNNPHNANGVSWYFNSSYSWGFAGLNDPLSRNSCDTGSVNPQNRLCWHTGGGSINGGWRCGSTTGLNGDMSWERDVYQSN